MFALSVLYRFTLYSDQRCNMESKDSVNIFTYNNLEYFIVAKTMKVHSFHDAVIIFERASLLLEGLKMKVMLRYR